MANIHNEPIMAVIKKAPWLMNDKAMGYYEETVSEEDTQKILENISTQSLTIICEGNNVFKQPLMLIFADNEIRIEKPISWDNSTLSFHLFFKCEGDNNQYFFQVDGAKYSQDMISTKKPAKIQLLQKRRFGRALASTGSKIIFRDANDQINSAFVQDISKGGMLVWTKDSKAHYVVNSILRDVFISVPVQKELSSNEENTSTNMLLPYTTKGKIVRRFTDQSSSRFQYGVSFIHENDFLGKRFDSIIDHLQDDSFIKNINERRALYTEVNPSTVKLSSFRNCLKRWFPREPNR